MRKLLLPLLLMIALMALLLPVRPASTGKFVPGWDGWDGWTPKVGASSASKKFFFCDNYGSADCDSTHVPPLLFTGNDSTDLEYPAYADGAISYLWKADRNSDTVTFTFAGSSDHMFIAIGSSCWSWDVASGSTGTGHSLTLNNCTVAAGNTYYITFGPYNTEAIEKCGSITVTGD